MFGNKKILAVIPARGGSKRIPKKNIVPLAGKPMINWTIEAAQSCSFIDRVIVSTDSNEIKEVAENQGVEIPFLRTSAMDDVSPASEATLSCLEQSKDEWGEFDVVVQLMPNCPLRTSDVIAKGIEKFFQNESRSQISYFKYGWMNPWWANTMDQKMKPTPLFPDAMKSRSQDLDNLYCPTGAVWISLSDTLVKHRNFYTDDYRGFIIDWISALDIDDEDDLELAEAVFQMKARVP